MKVQVMTLKLFGPNLCIYIVYLGEKKHINEVIKLLMITNLKVYYL